MNKKGRPSTDRRTVVTREQGVRQILHQMSSGLGALIKSQPRDIGSRLLLMLSKLADKEMLKDQSLIRAKLAARIVKETGDLDFSFWLVLLAIEINDKRFFIDFGKCLSGEIKDPTLFDKRDRDIAEIVLFEPEMSAKDAVRELEKRGHRGITEENFRMWKMRLLKVKRTFDAVLAQRSPSA